MAEASRVQAVLARSPRILLLAVRNGRVRKKTVHNAPLCLTAVRKQNEAL